jgi:membrane-associated protein
MSYRRFLSFNIFGAIGWVFSMTMSGYLLGNIPIIRANFEKVVIAIVLISVLPMVIEFIRNHRNSR